MPAAIFFGCNIYTSEHLGSNGLEVYMPDILYDISITKPKWC
jgi:hypothetical protein